MAGAENEQDRDGVAGAVGDRGERNNSDRGGADQRGTQIAYRLHQETEAARALLENIRDLIADDEDASADAIEGETNLFEAIGSAFKRLAELKAMSASIDAMIGDLKKRQDRFAAQDQNIRTALLVAMETVNVKRLEMPLGTLSLKAVAPKVEIIDESAIPAKFWKAQDPKIDKRALMDALKDKQEIPGATLSNGGQTIAVKFG